VFRFTANIMLSAAILLLVYLLFLVFKPFITPMVFAAVLVVIFYPLQMRLNQRFSLFWSSLISTIIVLIIIIIPALIIISSVVREAISLTQIISVNSVNKIMVHAHLLAAKFGMDLDMMMKDATQAITSQTGRVATYVISNVWNILIGIAVILLATFFFFRDGEKALKLFIKALPLNQQWSKTLIKDIGIMIKSNLIASFAAASIQGTVGGLTFAWLGLPAPILWGTVMGFFSIFPFIGSWLVWVPAVMGLALAGRVWDAIILVIIGIAVVNPVDNVLRPAIVASNTRLNGFLVFIGLLGGIHAFGLSGLLLGPVLMLVGMGLLNTVATNNITRL